jgi:hypothetical protein
VCVGSVEQLNAHFFSIVRETLSLPCGLVDVTNDHPILLTPCGFQVTYDLRESR